MPVLPRRLGSVALVLPALVLLALAPTGCERRAPQPPDAPQEASEAWQAAFQTALRARLHALAGREDLQSQRDRLRLQPLLRDFFTQPAPRLARERLGLIAQLREAAPADTEADWHHADLCVRPHAPAAQGCDPGPALRRLQAAEPDNAAVWLLAADAADARGDDAGFAANLRRAADAQRYDLHFVRHWSGASASLQRLPLPPLDALTRRYLNNGAPATVEEADMRRTLAVLASALPLPTGVVLRCRAPAAEQRADCLGAGRLMAGSDTLIGQTLGLSMVVRLSAADADGATWRERLRQAYWRNARAHETPQTAQFDALLRRHGEVAAYDALLRAAGQKRAPSDWLPDTPVGRALVLTGRSDDDASVEAAPSAAPAPH